MTIVPSPVDVAVNPNDPAQRLILWNTGRIDSVGGAPSTEHPDNTWWYDRLEPPGVAIHVTNWTTGAGYVLDYRGGFNPFGGAPAVGSGSTPTTMPGVPISGSAFEKVYTDWSWDPAGNGQGYVLTRWGELIGFGGAIAPSPAGPRFLTGRARRLEMQWTPSKKAYVMDMTGALWGSYFTALADRKLASLDPPRDVARDFKVTNWTDGSGYIVDRTGRVHNFGTAVAAFGWPYRYASDVARTLSVITTSPLAFLEVWSGGQQFPFTSSTPPTVVAGGGSNETQTVTITGSPTGGTFTLTYSGQTTAATAYNATAATLQTNLRALSSIGSTGVTVTKSGQVFTVAFGGTLAETDVAQMTSTGSFTGGSSPAAVVATSINGVTASPAATVTTSTRPELRWTYSDPQGDQQAAWQVLVFTQAWVSGHTMTDPMVWVGDAVVAVEGTDRTARGVNCPVDLANGSFVLYVRARDTSGDWSAWDSHSWTQNVAAPATPTGLTATANQATSTVALSLTTASGTANLVRFERSDNGAPYVPVVGADAITRTTTTTGTDYDAPLGVPVTYRAVTYAIDPRVVSAPSNTQTVTLTKLTHLLKAVENRALGGEVKVQDIEWGRMFGAGVLEGVGSQFPTVIKDGSPPKAPRMTLHLMTMNVATWNMLVALAESGSTLVYRGPFGEVYYCEPVGTWPRKQIKAAPAAGEQTPLRHLHTTELQLVVVRPPVAGA